MDSLDYRRFDHLGGDSDDDSVDTTPDFQQYERFAQDRPSKEAPSAGRRSGPIQVNPADKTAPAWVYADPDTWVAPTDSCELDRLPREPSERFLAASFLTQALAADIKKKETWGVCAAAADDPMQVRHNLWAPVIFRLLMALGSGAS